MATDGIRYIKIAKIDKNGNNQTNTLQSLNQVTIPFSTGNITYKVNNITEHPTFFLYYVDPAGVEWADRAEIKYDFTGSLTSIFHPSPSTLLSIIDINPETDNLGFLADRWTNDTNSSLTGSFYTVNTYPQKSIYIQASGSISVGATGSNPSYLSTNYTIYLTRGNTTYPDRVSFLDNLTFTSSLATASFNLSYSEPSISSSKPGDTYYLALIASDVYTTLTASILHPGSKFFVTSSDATGLQVGLVPEPYFGSNDFNRALDCQPLLNNAERVRRHNLYQDVDYSAGATEPVNFDLLISGSALRAEVQLSNYTSKRVIIPRYEGSKSTSQNLNKWTKGDTGTYGKTPTVESLKTVIAYCDWIGDWPPERSNSSAAHILYLIDSDGNISIPNTSETSLPNVQGAFQTGERFRVSSKTIGSGEADQFRTVIRGGQRIEPILYTQSGSAPNQQWNTTMSFEDIIPSVDGAVGNYISTNVPSGPQGLGNGTWDTSLYGIQVTSNLINANGEYVVPSGVISDGVSLFAQFKRETEYKFALGNPLHQNDTIQLRYRAVRESSGGSKQYYGGGDVIEFDCVGYYMQLQSIHGGNWYYQVGEYTPGPTISSHIPIPLTDLNANDKIYIEFQKICSDYTVGDIRLTPSGYYKVPQYPNPTVPVSSSGYNSMWNWGDPNTYPYIITSSHPTLIDLYDGIVKQTDIAGSGFNPIALPWSIKYGDEFRFEGREDFTYMVKEIYAPYDTEGRTFPTGSIEVHFSKNLPTGSSQSVFDLDHFLIRRYVDDASQILMEGFRPLNSSGPYILTPEYVTKDLNTNIDDVITDLKERGLITGEEGS